LRRGTGLATLRGRTQRGYPMTREYQVIERATGRVLGRSPELHEAVVAMRDATAAGVPADVRLAPTHATSPLLAAWPTTNR